MKSVVKKYSVIIITAGIVVLIGLGILFLLRGPKGTITVDKSHYSIVYDSTWRLKSEEEKELSLTHKSGSTINIEITELADEYRYSSIDELIDELIHNIEEQNGNYKLLSNKKEQITKSQIPGYKLLYENDKEQAMVVIFKKSDLLVIIRYQALNEYFDILLDSVNSIINSLNIKEKTFSLQHQMSVQTEEPNYNTSSALDNELRKTKTYEIASNNYNVFYSIPDIFELSEYNSQSNYFRYRTNDVSIDITANIMYKNLYEYLDETAKGNVYSSYNYYHDKDNDEYTDFKESISKISDNLYLYKNSYKYTKAMKFGENYSPEFYNQPYETAELIFAISNSHIFVVKITAKDTPITQKLINMIKLESSTNYSSYIKTEKEGNNLIGRLQRFVDSSKKKIDLVTIKVPDKYQEIDGKTNIYTKREYVLGYNEDLEIYDYHIQYVLSNVRDDQIIDSINSIYVTSAHGKSEKLTFTSNFTLNNKEFKVYSGGYTELSGILFTNINRVEYYINKKVLFYKMPDDGYLYIMIDGNGKEITEDMLKELTDFTVEQKDI